MNQEATQGFLPASEHPLINRAAVARGVDCTRFVDVVSRVEVRAVPSCSVPGLFRAMSQFDDEIMPRTLRALPELRSQEGKRSSSRFELFGCTTEVEAPICVHGHRSQVS